MGGLEACPFSMGILTTSKYEALITDVLITNQYSFRPDHWRGLIYMVLPNEAGKDRKNNNNTLIGTADQRTISVSCFGGGTTARRS